MRVADRPIPTYTGTRPAVEPFPAILHIGVERQPEAVYVYDDHTAFYDQPGYVYDELGDPWPYERVDLFCQFHGLHIESGAPDAEGNFAAGLLEMTLDNRDGALSQYDAFGRLVDYGPGSAIDVWCELDGADWWLFSGHVTAWRERSDDTVEVEAFDAFDTLNRQVPPWDPGVYGDTPAARLTAILAEHGYTTPTRLDPGHVTLHSYQTMFTPLDEMRDVAESDGGALHVDADGTLVYRDRGWITGRPDQTDIPTFTDNYCPSPVVAWDVDMTTDDDVMVNDVTLTNVAAVTVHHDNAASVTKLGRLSLPTQRFRDQWITVEDGAGLAAYLVNRRSNAYLRVQSFALYLHDQSHDLWRIGIDRRLGDIVTWLHEQQTPTAAGLIIVDLAVQQIVHDITPDTWVTTVATTRTINARIAARYDETVYDYDQADPANVYAY